MKVLNTLIYFVFLISSIYLFTKHTNAEACSTLNQNPCWIEKNPMPLPRWSIGAASNSYGEIYVVGGYDGNGTHAYNNLDLYNPILDTWTKKTNAPIELNSPGFAYSTITNKFYMAGGFTSSGPINNVFEYDPQTDSWNIKSPIPIPLHQFKFIEGKNGYLYAIGGISTTNCYGNIYEYNPTNNMWSYKSTMPTQRCDPAAVIDSSGIIYTIGGSQDSRFANNKTRVVEAYNISENNWTSKNAVPFNNYNNPNGALLNSDNKIYLIGGTFEDQIGNILNLAYEYDLQTNYWKSITPIPIGRTIYSLVSSDNKIYTIGGSMLEQITLTPSIFEGFKSDNVFKELDLNVPLIKQTSEPWGSKEYDSATVWNPVDSRIYSWGCALTSATMVFKYHGLNKLSGNTSLDPETLNDWLKKQKDGYVGNGYINWIALSRLSKHLAGINHIKNFHALEFEKKYTSDKNKVIDDLKNNIPDILGVPGHFIVAKGVANNIITINDPGYNKTTLSDYNNTYLTLNKFTPSKTDLSYIMLTVQPEVNIQLKNNNGDIIGEYFTEDPINKLNTNEFNSEPIKIVLLKKPEAQNFQISLNSTSNTDYSLGIYLYDKDGEVLKSEKTGSLSANENENITFYFDGQAELYPNKVSFGKFESDLNKANRENILNINTYTELKNILDQAQTYKREKMDEETLYSLILFEKKLIEYNSEIDPETFNDLLYAVNYLETHL